MLDEFKEAAARLYHECAQPLSTDRKTWVDVHPTGQNAVRLSFEKDWKVFVETCPNVRITPPAAGKYMDPLTATLAYQGRLKQANRVVGKATASTLIQTFKLAAHRCGGQLVIDK